MWRHVCLAAALASASACSQFLGIEDFKLADGGVDAPIDAPQFCYGTSLVRACFEAEPSAPLAQAAAINTDTGCQVVQAQASGPELCLIGATTIDITGTANIVTGGRPLVLVAVDTINVTALAVLDASSRTTTRVGAGANEATCPAPTIGQNSTAGAGGGGGAGFGTIGGDGGIGAVAAGVGGMTSMPTFLHGGCKGAAGGDNGTTKGGNGGNGGGAIYLIAGNAITINGSIFASAAGGTGGGLRGGGGGGASGGMIGLDAPAITIAATGIVAANGSSGGGGGGTGTVGGAGGDGQTTAYTSLATAGVGGTDGAATPTKNGGDGGRGAATNSAGGLGGARISSSAGGGGGGGGVGVLWVKGTLTGTRYSPNPTTAP